MTTSNDYGFSPSLGEIILYAYNIIGIRGTSLLHEHMTAARMAANTMLAGWSNKGVNLWKVDLVTVPLVEGQASYPVDKNTVTILDAYMTIDDGSGVTIDRNLSSISRTEFASYPNKTQQGFSTSFWFDRLLNPTDMKAPGTSGNPTVSGPQITLWPVPDGASAQFLKYYRCVQAQTANLQNGETPDVPYLWLEAFADGLAYRLAKIWKPEMAAVLKGIADESYEVAAARNTEDANQYIAPQLQSYFRN